MSAMENHAGLGGRLRRERGATMVEFAFVLILLLTLVLGIMGFGHALYVYHFLSNTSREASRWAAVNGSTCSDDGSCNGTGSMNNGPASATDIQNYALGLVPTGIDAAQLTVATSWPTVANGPAVCAKTSNAPGCTVQVTLSYNFTFIFPLLPTATVPMSSTSEMVIAH